MNKEKKISPQQIKHPESNYQKFENWALKNDKKVFYTLCALSLFLSLITFNARISEAHDDALYLEGGWRFVNEFPSYFYTQNAPLYPLFLALLIKLIGFKLIVFKLVSIVFNFFGFVLFYKAIKGKVPAIIFIPVAVFQACNHLIMYYASMTFTEAFYFFLQGLFFYYAVKLVEVLNKESVNLKSQLKLWLLFGFSLFLIVAAKSSATLAIPIVMLFFALEKNWRAVLVSFSSYLVFKVPYELIIKFVWGGKSQFSEQSQILLQKDPYNKSLGNEDFSGFIQRFIDNCNLSLSKRFYQLLGWRSEDSYDTYGYLTIITIAIALLGFWIIFKSKNKALVLLSLFTGAQMILSFVILQARWDQARITLVCMPIFLIMMLYALYHFTNRSGASVVYIVVISLLMGSVVLSSFKRGLKNIPIVQKNLKGDKYYGYTPDWQNFLKCSEWCADSLQPNTLVASRKAPMSFVYGKGKKFFPIYSVIKRDTATDQSNPDSALAFFKKNKVTHVMLASLRANPKDPNAGIITTMHYILAPIAKKYPEKLKLVHTEGAPNFEETSLYQLIY